MCFRARIVRVMKRVFVAEATGTALLLCAVVGSGIMGERLAGGSAALALLANSTATAAALVALIFTFAPISGAHFNPVVTIAAVIERGSSRAELFPRLLAQFLGAIAGVIATHLMFGLAVMQASARDRSGAAQVWSEVVATFGLVAVVHATGKRPNVVPIVVAAYIAAAYWFTSSTSFANPAVTLARAFTNTFTGIRLADVIPFIGAQLAGGLAATFLFRWLYAETR